MTSEIQLDPLHRKTRAMQTTASVHMHGQLYCGHGNKIVAQGEEHPSYLKHEGWELLHLESECSVAQQSAAQNQTA